MKFTTKNIFLFSLAALFLLDLLNVFISPDSFLFIYPSGSDYEIGKIMGSNSWRVIELAVIGYGFVLLFKKNNSQKNKNNIKKLI